MKKNPINFEYLSTVSPAKMQLYLLAAGISLSVQECTRLQELLRKHMAPIQALPQIFNEVEDILGQRKLKELLVKAASFL